MVSGINSPIFPQCTSFAVIIEAFVRWLWHWEAEIRRGNAPNVRLVIASKHFKMAMAKVGNLICQKPFTINK